MATVAKQDTAKKAERKKPVRKAPVQKNYGTKLEWLKAMTEYELAQSEVTVSAKVKSLDKRIAAKQALVEKTQAEVAELKAKRDALVPPAQDETDEDGLTEQDHLVLEGKA